MTPKEIPNSLLEKKDIQALKLGLYGLIKFVKQEETSLFAILLAIVLALRIISTFLVPINSDEPQHLHVIWSWTQGLVQYRDVFDNHTPLFHLLMIPFLTVWGIRPDIIIVMRITLLPIFLVILWITYLLSKSIFDDRSAALWTTLCMGTTLCIGLPSYYLRKSTEFRPANLWILLWLLILLSLIKSSFRWRNGFITGVLIGAALCVSLKTILMISSLIGATILMSVIYPWGKNTHSKSLPWIGGLVLGITIIPLIIIGFFSSLGALHLLFRCTITHNIMWKMIRHRILSNIFYAISIIIALIWLTKRLMTNIYIRIIDRRIIFLILVEGVYGASLMLYPVVEKETEISLYPLLIILAVGLASKSWDSYSQYKRQRTGKYSNNASYAINPLPFLLVTIVLMSIFRMVTTCESWSNRIPKDRMKLPSTYEYLLRDVSLLTTNSDYIMDPKGQSIYRKRPFYYALELFTKKGLSSKLIKDRIIERCIATKTCVVVLSKDYPRKDRNFFQQQYIRIDQHIPLLRVIGHLLGCRNSNKAFTLSFNIIIPTRYAIVAEKGKVTGLLDGKPYEGPRFLAAGRHIFKVTGGQGWQGWLALVWARALERGFKPIMRAGVCSG